jgi:hypothetical protein
LGREEEDVAVGCAVELLGLRVDEDPDLRLGSAELYFDALEDGEGIRGGDADGA